MIKDIIQIDDEGNVERGIKNFDVDLDELCANSTVLERVNNEDLIQKANFTIHLEQDGTQDAKVIIELNINEKQNHEE